MKRNAAFCAVAALCATPSLAATTLTNGTGDGKLTVSVGSAGAYGSSSGGLGSDALYDPVGATAAGRTTYESYVYLGFGGARTNLSALNATVTASSTTSVSSTFTYSGLAFSLVQTLGDLLTSGMQAGSLLTQTYSFTNTTGRSLTFDMVRYLDGDLYFNNTDLNDGGGRLVTSAGQEILFETDTAIGSAQSDTFIGIVNDGGTSSGYEIASFSGLRGRISNGNALANIVQSDGPDADQFVDAGAGYDVTLGLSRAFTVAAGGSGTFTTQTIFGTGQPDQVVLPPSAVPEPATWAMFIGGFGLVGGALRRRRVQTTVAFI
jgi:hypothetical protein